MLAAGPSRSTRAAEAAAPWRHVDWALLATLLLTAAFGVLMVYSATHNRLTLEGGDPMLYLKRQAIFVVVGLCGMATAVAIDYRILRDFGPLLLAATCGVLVLVLSPIGSTSRGTQAWFQLGPFQLQPSEFAKVSLVVALAGFCAERRGELDLQNLAKAVGLAGIPIGLIYLQPDLGSSLVLVSITAGILLVGGARPRHMAALVLIAAVGVFAVIQLGILKEYQLDRLGAFLDPESDSQRSTYNLNQSKIAIGAGGLTGRGLFEGTQTNLSYVPEQHTDFIFTVVGEELGLVGGAALLLAYAVMIWRIWRAAALAKDLSGTLICVGVLTMLMFQIFENVGMTMGIMPVTGIPLPFMSAGGSSTIAAFVAVGLVLNVHMRRFS
ncbi:MAG TPA: rod shape-determining protein RodA [Acidimicrobiales bacterium]|nr:rod shape-determining protein RodA [Acidimicrobiales bacterium]